MKTASFFPIILLVLSFNFFLASCSDNNVLTLVSDPYSELLFFNREQQQKIDGTLKKQGYTLNYVLIDTQEVQEKTLKGIEGSDITIFTPFVEDSLINEFIRNEEGHFVNTVYKLNFADGSVLESENSAPEIVLTQNKAWESLGKEITASGSITNILFLYKEENKKSLKHYNKLKQNLLGAELIPIAFPSEESINLQRIEQQISDSANADNEYMIICDMGEDTHACLNFCETSGWKAAVVGGALLPHYKKSLLYSIELDMSAAAASIVSRIEEAENSQKENGRIDYQPLHIDDAWKVINLDK